MNTIKLQVFAQYSKVDNILLNLAAVLRVDDIPIRDVRLQSLKKSNDSPKVTGTVINIIAA